MAYLKNEYNEIIVDAVLTKFGREKLANQGNLGITKFALSDDEIDYTLYNVNHPNGTDYYDVAIRELPILEALPGNSVALKYLLFTPSTTTISNVSTLTVSYPAVFTSGVSMLNVPYAFTPQLSPPPSSDASSRIYFVAEISDVIGATFELTGHNSQQNEEESNDILTARVEFNNAQTPYKKYAVGQYFVFKLLSNPRAERIYPVTVTAYGPVNAVPYKFNIKVLALNDQRNYVSTT